MPGAPVSGCLLGSPALECEADGGASLRSFRGSRSTRTALHLEAGLSFEDWQRIGCHVRLINDASAWWIGDWLVYGQNEYGRRYRNALEATGLDYQTLRNYAWVASRFHMSRRRDKLSMGHHAEVASLPEADQDMWLDRAGIHSWSRNELRRRLQAARSADAASPRTIAIAVTPSRHERWTAAAEAEQRDLRDWIEAALDRAADSILEADASLGRELHLAPGTTEGSRAAAVAA